VLLSVNASAANNGTVWAHVYGITNNTWSQSTLSWNNAQNLAQNISPGTNYSNNFLLGAGISAEIVGQLVATGNVPAERLIDVTDFVRRHPGTVSFLLVRPVGFFGDAQDNDSLSIISTEGSSTKSPRLIVVTNASAVSPPVTNSISDIVKNTDGSVTINFLGTAGLTYRVLANTNIDATNWPSIATNIASTNGSWFFNDLQSTNLSSRFYRAVYP
ncbi:MAG: hypothetical protein ACR2H1_15370, partial [Limisphaerales bacterium]